MKPSFRVIIFLGHIEQRKLHLFVSSIETILGNALKRSEKNFEYVEDMMGFNLKRTEFCFFITFNPIDNIYAVKKNND